MSDERTWPARLAPLAPDDSRGRTLAAGLAFGLAGMAVGVAVTTLTRTFSIPALQQDPA